MDEDERVKRVLQTIPPSCIAGFRTTPAALSIEFDDSCRSVWRLACVCGTDRGYVLGYRLRDYNKELPNADDTFISPIGFECTMCGRVTEVIDTDRHGYHSEMAKRGGGIGSVKYRGEGSPTRWACSECKSQEFGLTVGFVFWDAVFDLADQPDWPLQDFFNVFLTFAKCTNCGHLSEPADLGKL